MLKNLEINSEIRETHKVWHKFSGYLAKTFGKDLFKWQHMKLKDPDGKKKTKILKWRDFDEGKLSERLVGYKVQIKIERYIKRYCPEIKIVPCDDSVHSSSYLLLIPHPYHGITIIFIPQCTSIKNQFFLYNSHYENLMKELQSMKYVYKNKKRKYGRRK